MNRHTHSLVLAAVTLLCSSLRGQAQEVRPWTDKASGRKIQASMVSADPKARTVTIKGADGKSFTLPVDRLVDADLAYIKAHLNAPPASAPPAAGAPSAPAPAAAAPAGKAPAGEPAPPRPQVAVISVKAFKRPAGSDIIGKVKKVHPRLLMNAEGFAALKARTDTDPTAKALLANVNTTVEQLLALPELSKVFGAEAASAAPGRQGLFRLAHLGVLNYVKPDPRFPDRAVKEMLALSKDFTSWNPDKPDICSEFVWGIALGYDWFRPAMNNDQAKIVRKTLMEFGMEALVAYLKDEPIPINSRRAEPGQDKTLPTKANAKPGAKPPVKKKEDKDELVSTDHMKAASALLLAAMAIADEEPAAAAGAAMVAAKVFGKGMTQFAPDGIWPETLESGDEVLDIAASVIMSMRSACGTDFGLSSLEGLPNIGVARMALTGPAGLFNYGDVRSANLNRPWVTSWLAALYGNPGVPALKVPPATAAQNAGLLGQAGLLIYNSPNINGYGTPDALDYAFNGSDVATLRSAWNDSKALFAGIKGGDNNLPGAQLDLGTFVLDAGGVRWAVDLGGDGDRAPGMARPKDKPNDPNKYKLYREGSQGQNIVYLGEDQSMTGRGNISAFLSTPERGLVIVDVKGESKVKDHRRGLMMVRGANPYVLIQDEMRIKSTAAPVWTMHTRAAVTVDGGRATLKSGAGTLTMKVLAPKDAKFVAEDIPEPTPNSLEGSFKGIKVIKVALGTVKSEQTIVVEFASGDAPADAAVVPLAAWIKKK